MKYYCGVDPGAKGCICFLSENSDIEFYDYPKKEHEEADYWIMLHNLYTSRNVVFTVLERVHSMPHQSAQSSFTFGVNYGQWKMFLQFIQKPYDLVTPQKWMKSLNIAKADGKTTKEVVQSVIKRLYPTADVWGKKGAYKDGRGDSLLISRYASL